MIKDPKPTVLGGIVVAFAGNGRKLGYPTANIRAKTKLKDGVYFGFANLGKYNNQPTIIFIGTPTTVGDTERRVEAHLFDIANKDYYGLPLKLQIYSFHRANQHFASVEELLVVMKADEVAARQWFKEHVLATPKHVVDT